MYVHNLDLANHTTLHQLNCTLKLVLIYRLHPVDTEPSPVLLCIADMANGRNSGPRHIPAPMSEMWRLVWTEYLLFFAIVLDQLTKLFEHSPYQWHRRDASDVQIIILSIHQTRSQKGFSYAIEGALHWSSAFDPLTHCIWSSGSMMRLMPEKQANMSRSCLPL